MQWLSIIEILLGAWFVLTPVYIYFNHDKDRQAVEADPSKRVSMYKSTIALLWAPTLVLMFLVYNNHFSLAELGWQWPPATAALRTSLVLSILTLVCIAILFKINNNKALHSQMRAQMGQFRYFMPTTRTELGWVTAGVSTSAGICEELLFRGFLLYQLTAWMPTTAAVAVSSLLFGLCHCYQGVVGIVKTGLLGVVFCLCYITTDSLLAPILLHILIDVYSTTAAYLALRKQDEPVGQAA